MATSRLELAIVAVEAALNTITFITGLTVERARVPAVRPADCPRLIVYAGEREQLERVVDLVIWNLPVTIAGWITTSAEADLGPEINELYGAAHDAIEADKTLGGAALYLYERELETVLDRVAGHRPMMGFEATFDIRVQTTEASPASAPT